MRTRGRKKRFADRLKTSGGISMVSMTDILTTLLFFVLKSFVAGGDTTAPPPGLALPKSTAEAAMQSSVVVVVDHDAILVGSDRVASVSDVMHGDGMLIEPLAARLQEAREQADDLAHRKGQAPSHHIVTVQGDAAVEFRVLQRVMYTVNQSGFEDISLAVLKKSREASA